MLFVVVMVERHLVPMVSTCTFSKVNGVVKEDIMMVFEEFFASGSFDCRLNESFIALIPKCAFSTCLNNYRSISLVGSLYKIIAKVLANRLRGVVSDWAKSILFYQG